MKILTKMRSVWKLKSWDFCEKAALLGAVRGWLPQPDRRPLLELAATDRNNGSLGGAAAIEIADRREGKGGW